MPRFFTEKISVQELASKILATMKRRALQEHSIIKRWQKFPEEDWDFDDPVKGVYKHQYSHLFTLTEQVKSDFSKVDFWPENQECEGGYVCPDLCGFRTLENGLTYLGISGGGDWEIPLFYIIYWDGKNLRGYIPKDGNTWNTDKKAAYNNNEAEDLANVLKRGFVTQDEVDKAKVEATRYLEGGPYPEEATDEKVAEFAWEIVMDDVGDLEDSTKIRKDILNRIQFKG